MLTQFPSVLKALEPMWPAGIARISGLAAVILCLSVINSAARDCESEPPEGALVIGVRQDAPPFSAAPDYAPEGREHETYWGYTVDLCREFAESTGARWCFSEVSPQSRWVDLAGGKIDMLCGATTMTLNAANTVTPSLYTFVTATTLMTGPIPAQKATVPRIGYRSGTTAKPEETFAGIGADGTRSVPSVIRRAFPDIAGPDDVQWIPVDDHRDALTKLESGEIAAYIADRPILSALRRIAGPELRQSLQISPGSVRLQPYAVMFPATDEGRARAFEFNRFLIETRFTRGAFDAYRRELRDRFGSDVDVSFLTLAALQGEIPEGETLVIDPE